ncbi:YafY family protein [Planococcus sp. 107-1]|uniref:helix-turn-helix transcriptional regulator n=1 Tax=Planococcus sp. 107-1 TaxID=2908840 RepID=UPI001F29AB92|nr:YafY family protein [Planococcus sp. 107-1]UJF25530.1 YafY family transcriptional regulator [Planococcus sp. 107-1]
MKKIERLISIVMILLQKEIVSASELSRLFNVSKRTIQRDMESLSYANIPVYAEYGPDGGYGLMNEYKFDKRLLNSQDLENILVSLDGYDQLITDPEIQVTIQKIKAMANANLSANLDLTFYNWTGRSELKENLSFIKEAIEKSWLIKFDYIDQLGKRTVRLVEPYRLHLNEMDWYLSAYCTERSDYRTFKLTRMIEMKKEGLFKPRLENRGKTTLMQRESLKKVQVELLIEAAIRDQFIERYGQSLVTEISADSYLVEIELPENHFAYQFLAGFGNKLKILKPQTFVEKYLHFLEETIGLYK